MTRGLEARRWPLESQRNGSAVWRGYGFFVRAGIACARRHASGRYDRRASQSPEEPFNAGGWRMAFSSELEQPDTFQENARPRDGLGKEQSYSGAVCAFGYYSE